MEIIKENLEEFEQNSTLRVTSSEIDKILYKKIKALDHGFVRVIDYMGADSAIVQAARVSYGKGTKKVNEDQGLINYLMRHRHTTPFEMCEIKFHIKLPIFIARQWVRHRTANINEYSGRYSILSKEFYIPEPENIALQSPSNNQGRMEEPISREKAEAVINILTQDAERCYQHYREFLNIDEENGISEEPGIARELARMNLTLNYYTEWYWKIDLHNLFHFLALRADSHAQYEIRVYADIMLEIVKLWVPMAYKAFCEYRLEGAHFSKSALEVIKRMVKGEKITQEMSGMSKREWKDFEKLLESQ